MPEPIRIHLDENCDVGLAFELRKYGIDVTTTYEVGLRGAIDRKQLEFARSVSRVIVTHDFDMIKLHKAKVAHHGIIYSKMNRLTSAKITDRIIQIDRVFDRDGMIGLLFKLKDRP